MFKIDNILTFQVTFKSVGGEDTLNVSSTDLDIVLLPRYIVYNGISKLGIGYGEKGQTMHIIFINYSDKIMKMSFEIIRNV